jgi:hypothetical protein
MIDVFQPDYVYYDNGWGMYSTFEPYRRFLGAYQYNKAIAAGRGTYGAPGVVLVYKAGGGNANQFVTGGGVLDVEGGVPGGIQTMPFQTDLKIGDTSWGYLPSEKYKGTKYLLAYLLDVVSKNGNLMLDIPPKGDGTLPDTVTKMLNEIGGWLHQNGEGVYATRPANIYGTGAFRFTRNQANNVIYIFDTIWPGNNAQLAVPNYNSTNLTKANISKITLLGGTGSLAWTQNATALYLTMPAALPPACKYIYGFKIYLDAASTAPVAPSNLEAIGAAKAVVLTWVDNSSKETGYKIERKNGSTGTYVQIATVGADIGTFTDTMTTPVAYTYRVYAYNTAGNSAYSNEATPAGLLSPSAICMPNTPADSRDARNNGFVTAIAGGNTIRIMSAYDASATLILYAPNGSSIAQKTASVRRGLNTVVWDKLRSGSASICFLDVRINGRSQGVVRMVKTR